MELNFCRGFTLRTHYFLISSVLAILLVHFDFQVCGIKLYAVKSGTTSHILFDLRFSIFFQILLTCYIPSKVSDHIAHPSSIAGMLLFYLQMLVRIPARDHAL